jgi:predicted nuclease of predicted toxin-antitoxin system
VNLWLDAQLSLALAPWITAAFAIPASPLRDLGLRDARDREIFFAARAANVIVMTKDVDFIHLMRVDGPPPRVIWLRCGNTSNARLRNLLLTALPQALALFQTGESLVEVVDPH